MSATLSRNEELVRLYVDEEMSLVDLAKRYNCHHGVVRGWLESLGVTMRTKSEAMALVSERRMIESLPAGMARCACGTLMPEGATECEFCSARKEYQTERQAEEELFSASAFLGNPRNIGRYDPSKVDCIRGVIPVW
jgi:transposase-like protein